MDINANYGYKHVHHHGKKHHGRDVQDRQGHDPDRVTLSEQSYDRSDKRLQASMFQEMHGTASPEPAARIGTTSVKLGDEHTVNIGTFNVEWLGSEQAGGLRPRTDKDYNDMASIIKDSGANIMGLEEVGTEEALRKLVGYLPGFDYIMGTTGVRDGGKSQRIAIIYDTAKVQCDKSSMEEIKEVMVPEIAGEGRLRAPVAVNMKSGDFDFTFVACHMKARMDDQGRAIRMAQAEKMNEWIDNKVKNGEKDVIVVGDFNDFVDSPPLKKMNSQLYFVTKEAAEKGEYSNIKFKSVIDQIGVSTVAGGARENFIPGSVSAPDIGPYPGFVKRISDHRPMVASFRTDADAK
jgi:endonuclease/exonuclease/phosphatase family metal-dependent hydrolase